MFGAPGAWGASSSAPGGASTTWSAPGSTPKPSTSTAEGGSSYSVWGLPQPIGQKAGAVGAIGSLGGGAWTPSLPVVAAPPGSGSPAAAPGLPPPPAHASSAQVAAPDPSGLPIAPPSAIGAPAPAVAASAGPLVVKCKGLPLSATVEKVQQFFNGLDVPKGNVHIRTNDKGLPTGECFVSFSSEESVGTALERNRQVLGHRFVTVERATVADAAQSFPCAKAPAPPPPANATKAATSSAPSKGSAASAAGGGGAPYMLAATATAAPVAEKVAPSSARGAGGRDAQPVAASSARAASGRNSPSGPGNGGSSGAGGARDDSAGTNIVIKMRGLPYSTTETEISDFFSGLQIAPGGVSVGRDASGRASGEAHVEFLTDQDAQSAMLLNRQRIGSRYIELFRTKQAPVVTRRGMAAASAEGGSGTSDSLRLRGMPFNSTEADVQSFFKGYSVAAGGIKLGPQVGQGTVKFSTAEDARRALVTLNHSYMGNRYIELFYAS